MELAPSLPGQILLPTSKLATFCAKKEDLGFKLWDRLPIWKEFADRVVESKKNPCIAFSKHFGLCVEIATSESPQLGRPFDLLIHLSRVELDEAFISHFEVVQKENQAIKKATDHLWKDLPALKEDEVRRYPFTREFDNLVALVQDNEFFFDAARTNGRTMMTVFDSEGKVIPAIYLRKDSETFTQLSSQGVPIIRNYPRSWGSEGSLWLQEVVILEGQPPELTLQVEGEFDIPDKLKRIENEALRIFLLDWKFNPESSETFSPIRKKAEKIKIPLSLI